MSETDPYLERKSRSARLIDADEAFIKLKATD
jgi:hypothetical protein